ncbi:MAG: efflux RND transporter periplasmic adaptor subunit [Pirellulaceae bacterium]
MKLPERTRLRRWIFLMLVLVLTGGAMGGLHQLQQSPDESAGGSGASSERGVAAATEPIIALEGERIELRPVQRAVSAVGNFFGYDELTVMAEVTGRVARVYHDVGDIVRPGDVLMELDKTEFELELELTRRALELEVIRMGIQVPEEPLSPEQIADALRTFKVETLPSLVRAQQLERIAWWRLQRAEQLLEANAMSQEESQQRKTEYDVAKSALDQAGYDAQAALAAVRHRVVQLRIAMRELELATIYVPTPTQREYMPEQVQYAVVQRKATEGEMLKDAPGSSTATFELVIDGVLKLEAQVPERYAAEVKRDQEVQVRVDAYPNRIFTGKVVRINPAVDRNSRTFGVTIYVPNPDRELKAGGFAQVEILTRVDPQAWTVSPESIVTYAGSTRVFVARDGKAHTISVETGIEGSGWVELLHAENPDLREDDILIRGGQDKLAEGVPVQIRNAAQLAPAEARPPVVK